MISVSDILKILDSIPIWKSVKALPDRMKELEGRVERLEKALAAPPRKSGPACPVCDAPMKVTKVEEDPIFGKLGAQRHHYACTACDHTESRKINPS
jgi:hypothetical protein